MAIRLLSKLPERFDAYFQSLVSSPRPVPVTWEEVLPSIMQIESRFEERTGTSGGADGALAARDKGKSQQKKGKGGSDKNSKDSDKDKDNKSSKNKDIECHYCGKKGHKSPQCHKKKRDEAAKNSSSTAVSQPKKDDGIPREVNVIIS